MSTGHELPAVQVQRPGSKIGFDQLLDAIPDASAVLDGSGTIVAVNRAWRMFTADNAGRQESTGVGVNYFDVCRRSAAAGCEDAAAVLAGLRTVLAGDSVESVLDYPCPSPEVGRWFSLRVTPLAGSTPGALVTHVNITRQKIAEIELVRQASQDSLTGLANRARFDQRLHVTLGPARGNDPDEEVGLVYLDLDGFKPVNDTYGHAAGDEVLQTVASRLSKAVRPLDVVARIGGDEFTVLAAGINAEQLAALAGRIEQVLAQPHLIHGRQVVVGASVGCCLAHPQEAPLEAVRRADQAMYAAKHKRRAPARGTSPEPAADEVR